jgi:rubrerythrin
MSSRRPPSPEVVRRWIRRWAGVEPEVASPDMVAGALRALDEAVDRPGRNREAAEALLAADALLTWAMEDAADAPDPPGALRELLERVVASERGSAEGGDAPADPAVAVALLVEARTRERAQARFYRALAAEAELAGADREAERLNELLADEQHHLSRVSARLLELGGASPEFSGEAPPRGPWTPVALEGWEGEARARESEEVAFYREAEETPGLDPRTRELLREIRASEEHHQRELGGKWMSA